MRRLDDCFAILQGFRIMFNTIPRTKANLYSEPSFVEKVPVDTASKEKMVLKESAIPVSKIGRWLEYTGLAIRIGTSTIGNITREKMSRNSGSSNANQSSLWSEKNVYDLVHTLSKMRGAALKLGQMLTIQGSDMFPLAFEKILQRLRHGAHKMPTKQMYKILETDYGMDWRSRFIAFSEEPIAAASIGQVHKGSIINSTHDQNPIDVAIKIQYPGIKDSLKSDMDQLRGLLVFSHLLPKGIFLDNIIRVAENELGLELDYTREAQSMEWFRSTLDRDKKIELAGIQEGKSLLGDYGLRFLQIPRVISSTDHTIFTVCFV
jgi:aarF domain-containing kinase